MDTGTLYTVDQAAEKLGMGRTKLYRLMKEGKISYFQIEGQRKLTGECLNRYLLSVMKPAKNRGIGQ